MKDYSKLFITKNITIIEALSLMDLHKKKLLIVVEENSNKLISLLSIGDCQRAILSNTDLNQPIASLLNKKNITATTSDSLTQIKALMLNIRAEFMPILNEESEIEDVIFWEDIFDEKTTVPIEKFDVPVVIMAGGYGTRLKPITNVLPKPLIPLGDKSMLEEIFERFYKHGSKNFHISVNYKAELIEYYLKSQNLPYDLNFFKEDKPLGTAGSLHLLKGKLNETFFVTNCDILVEQDYSEILKYHKENKNEITLVAALKNIHIPYGTMDTGDNGVLLNMAEKPNITLKINAGLYILEPELINEIPQNEFFHITHLIEKIMKRDGKVGVFPVSEKSWKDIGEWDTYLKNKIN
jgi:dTDP-glucose pyrophosphorylase